MNPQLGTIVRRFLQALSGPLLGTRFEKACGVTDSPEVRFMETAAGMPSAVKSWWYGGERIGYTGPAPKRFIVQAEKIAAHQE